MKKFSLILSIMLSLIAYGFVSDEYQAIVMLPTLNFRGGQQIDIPISVTTDSLIGMAHFVVEYDSQQLLFNTARLGSGVPNGFAITNLNSNLPFAPTTPRTNENVMIQVAGGGSKFFSGTNLEIVVLEFKLSEISPDSSPLAFDKGILRTNLTTIHLNDIAGSNLEFIDGSITCSLDIKIRHPQTTPPNDFGLDQNHPNPFNAETVIAYQFPQDTQVSLKIYDLTGQEIRTLVDEQKSAGHYQIRQDGTDPSGNDVSSGIYLYTIQSGKFRMTKKIIKLK